MPPQRSRTEAWSSTRTIVVTVTLVVLAGAIATGTVLSVSDAGPTTAEAGGSTSHQQVQSQQQSPSGFAGVLNASEADSTLLGAAENDTAGYAVASAGDVNGDGVDDVLVGAPLNDTPAGNDSGAAYLLFGPVEGDEIDLAEADVTFDGVAAGDRAGWSVASAGDVNGDGVDDVLVGAPLNDENGDYAGAVYVVHGGEWLSGTTSLTEANATLYGGEDDRAGWSVSNTSALPGNESGVLVGAPTDDDGTHDAGVAFVVSADDVEGNVSLETEAAAELAGVGAGDHAGTSVHWAGDVNDDGMEDVVVGAPDNDSAGENAGAAYLVHGPVEGSMNLSEANVTAYGEAPFDNAGHAVATAGDLNDDGVADVAIGAPSNNSTAPNAGAAYVVYGSDAPSAEVDLAEANLTLAGAGAGDRAGWSVAPAGSGDVTCDGVDDLLVGAPSNDSTAPNAGVAYIVAGGESLSGERNLTDADATFVGAGEGDRFGAALGSAGDQNDDGVDDVLVGAPLNDSTAPNAGAAYVFAGDCPEPPEKTPTPTDEPEEPVGVDVGAQCTDGGARMSLENVNEETVVRVEVTGPDGFEEVVRLDPGERETVSGLADGRYRVATFVGRERVDVKRVVVDCEVEVTGTASPTASPTPTPSPAPSPTPPPTPTETATPSPTLTPAPTATPSPVPTTEEQPTTSSPTTTQEPVETPSPAPAETPSPTPVESPSPSPTLQEPNEETPQEAALEPVEEPDEPEPEPEGPQYGDVESDASTRIVSHDLKDYPDGRASVGGTIANPTDGTLSLVRVTITLYDASGAVVAQETDEISNLPPGGATSYVVTFDDVPAEDVDRYRVESTAIS